MEPKSLGNILVVDDELQLMQVLVEALTLHGYTATGFLNGASALEALQAQEFDLLLTDLMMPEMDGMTLLKAAMALESNLVGILMTGQGTVPTAVEAMKIGAFDYILKPFKMTDILPVLSRASEFRRLRVENIQLRETIAIYKQSQALKFSFQAQHVLAATAEAVLEQTQADEVSIMLHTSENLVITWINGKARAPLLGQARSMHEGIAGWVAHQGEPLLLHGEVSDPRFAPIHPRPEIRSAISMPLLAGGKIVGVLNANRLHASRPFTEGQIKALSVLTNSAAVALQNQALFEDLERREKRFRALINNAPDGIALLEKNGTLRQLTPSTERILGYSLEEAHAQDLALFTFPEDTSTLLTAIQALSQHPGQIEKAEFRYKHKDGSWRWLESTMSNSLTDPGIQGIIFNYRDITRRKQAAEQIQRQLERMKALHTIDLAISSTFDLKLSLDILLKGTVLQLAVDSAAILLFKPLSLTLEYIAGHGFRTTLIEQTRLRVGEGLAGHAALDRQLIHIQNLSQAESDFARPGLLQAENFMAYYVVPLIAKGELKGVLEIFHRTNLETDSEWRSFLETLAGQAAIAIDNSQLFSHVQRSKNELSMAYEATIEGWSRAMDLRDKETEGHSQRVTELTLSLARAAGVPEEDLIHIRRGALLHDMGKMGVPDAILLKPGKLTDEEWVIMRKHPEYAYNMLSPIVYLRPALDIPYCHHEKWDGSGYPRGLKGNEIPLAARLFAVADVWDALTSDRPYRPAWSPSKTLAYLQEQAGSHFDPQAIAWFLQIAG